MIWKRIFDPFTKISQIFRNIILILCIRNNILQELIVFFQNLIQLLLGLDILEPFFYHLGLLYIKIGFILKHKTTVLSKSNLLLFNSFFIFFKFSLYRRFKKLKMIIFILNTGNYIKLKFLQCHWLEFKFIVLFTVHV